MLVCYQKLYTRWCITSFRYRLISTVFNLHKNTIYNTTRNTHKRKWKAFKCFKTRIFSYSLLLILSLLRETRQINLAYIIKYKNIYFLCCIYITWRQKVIQSWIGCLHKLMKFQYFRRLRKFSSCIIKSKM